MLIAACRICNIPQLLKQVFEPIPFLDKPVYAKYHAHEKLDGIHCHNELFISNSSSQALPLEVPLLQALPPEQTEEYSFDIFAELLGEFCNLLR